MFLNRLKKKEKKAFLELAHYIARVDDDFSEIEELYIKSYCKEMKIKDIKFNENDFSLVDILEVFKTQKSKKIVLLEIAGLIYSDDILHFNENNILYIIARKFNIDEYRLELYKEFAKSMLSIAKQGELLLKI